MAFKVIPTRRTMADIHDIVFYIAQDSVRSAEKWFNGFWEIAQSLEHFPFRFALIPEDTNLREAYRSCLYHSHRIIYRVDEKREVVYIVRVYHVARIPLKESEME